MTESVRPAPTGAEVPLFGSAALIRRNLRGHRKDLFDHNVEAINLASRVLGVMHEMSTRCVNEIRADRKRRYRSLQLMGERGLPIEDFVAIALESASGREIAELALRIMAEAVGCSLVRNESGDTAAALLEATARLAREQGELVAEVVGAEADGTITPAENERIQRRARRVAENAQVTARVSARRVLNAQKKVGK